MYAGGFPAAVIFRWPSCFLQRPAVLLSPRGGMGPCVRVARTPRPGDSAQNAAQTDVKRSGCGASEWWGKDPHWMPPDYEE